MHAQIAPFLVDLGKYELCKGIIPKTQILIFRKFGINVENNRLHNG